MGLSLQDAFAELDAADCRYAVEYTVPTRDYFKVYENVFYVVRQRREENGSYCLIAAAKMRKEV